MAMLGLAVRQTPGLVLGLFVGAMLLVGGFLLATSLSRANASHDATGSLHACVNRYTGVMRYVTNPARCSPSEFAVDWNQAGLSGEPGQDGVSGYQIVDGATVDVDTVEHEMGIATCPTGSVALGGGAVVEDGDFNFYMFTLESHPSADGSSWITWVRNDYVSTQSFHVRATCAAIPTL